MIKILHVVSSMNRGGLETFIMNVYRKLDRSEIQFDFLVHTEKQGAYDKEIERLGGKIYRVPSRRQGIYHNKKKLRLFFEKHVKEYAAVHMHESSLSYMEPLKAAKKAGAIKIIIHGHSTGFAKGSWMHWFLHKVHRLVVCNYATTYLACSQNAAYWMFGKKANVQIISNGIDIDRFRFNYNKRQEIRDELGISEDEMIIGHVGRFSYPKNHKKIIDIFEKLLQKKKNIRLLLIGEGKLKTDIEQYIRDKQIVNNVIFMGAVGNVDEILNCMDIFLFPSIYEGLPISLIEAQASGLCCFVSDTVTEEVKITPLISYLPLECDADFWAENIVNAFSQMPDRQAYFGKVKESGYSINRTVDDLKKIYIEKN